MRGKRLTLLAVLLSVLALACSVLSLGISLSKDDPTTVAGPATGTDLPAQVDPTAVVSTTSTMDDDTVPAPTDTGEVQPQADYTLAYEGKRQRIPDGTYEDLDEPRVDVGSDIGDIYYWNELNLYGNAAAANSEQVTPDDCAEAIQNTPLTDPVAPKAGQIFCLQTSADQANSQGVTQKMVRVVIKDIDKEGTLLVDLSAWNVPA